ncbi:MAG: AlpA family phage regulatory protein [Alphaproteobacteria bacterium]|nr:AlpA family phage regulatory protein [Alphaproteobacteria bacterium]MDP1533577.1 AlpA family phage regulatory protein [Rubrivivax sp.]
MVTKSIIPSLDSLFGEAVYISARKIAQAVETSETTVWRWSKSGKLPKPYKLGEGTTRWRADEVCAALAKLAA